MADLTPPDDLHHGTEILFREWQGSVADLVNAVEKGLAEEVAPHGLALQEFNLLRACYELARECTATELARLLPVDPARISRIVNTLVDNGLLRRRRTREDRRVVMLRLSEEGRELTSRILRDIRRYDAKLTEGVGADEMQVFLSVTAKIIANHAAMQQPESPGTA
ncbi:MAG: MarR family transcriptional regulator [Acidobacteriota bacterium]|nr:MarR family transcriptional regulator [Acidobacteriota bacterium]